MRQLLYSRLEPFRHRNFRRFFFVQTLSLIGTWASDLARAWLILQMKGTALALGGLMLATSIPGLFLILHGGVLVDRVDVRRLMISTKLLLAFIACGLAIMVEFSSVQYWQLLLFGLLEGLVNAFDTPAYQALTVRLVPRHDFQQALALNSINFHAARMAGPALAGILMAWHGPSLVFLADGLTYLVLVFILMGINLGAAKRATEAFQGQWYALLEGIRYIYRTPALRYKVFQLLLTISLMYPLLLVVFRTYIKTKFNLNAESFGYVFTLPALGSMMGALSFAVIKPKTPIRALIAGVPGATVMVLLVPLMNTPLTAALPMAFAGFFMYLTFASLNVSMQLEVAENFRGRLSSVIGLCFVSIGPLMSFPVGFFADHMGFVPAIHVLTAAFVLGSAVLAFLHRHLRLRPATL